MGGDSPEREVSLRSGEAIYNTLHRLGYDVVAVDVRSDVASVIEREGIEIAFLALHGGYGENGAIQGLLEVMGVLYTGSSVLSSAIAMNKLFSKKIFTYHDLPVADFVVINNTDDIGKIALSINFPLPWVVKPVSEGSSIGVSVISNRDELKEALDRAFSYNSQVLIERFIKGKEIHVGILGDRVLGSIEVRPKSGFYDYKSKYTKGLTEYIIPPEVDKKTLNIVESIAKDAHKALGCSGVTRVDIIVNQEDAYLLEVNTLPGMTETSLIPKIAAHAG
ncbi:MAG: D-alanine--D-alanine ligase, partial [Nitrospirae bacterium]